MKRSRAGEFDSRDLEGAGHGGFARALLLMLVGFALGAGATFLAWRYNFLAQTSSAASSGEAAQPLPPGGKETAPGPAPVLSAETPTEPGAQNDLGARYQHGKGLQQNDSEAVKWYRKAAERDFPLAQSNLAWMLENGRGVDKDSVSAFFWYKLAAQNADVNGQYQLALLYEQGRGTARDLNLALEWFEKVAQQGFAPGRTAAARVRVLLEQSTAAAPTAPASVAAVEPAAASPRAEDSPPALVSPSSPEAPPADSAAVAPAAKRDTALALTVDVDNEFDGAGYSGTWHQRGAAVPGNQVIYRAERRGDRVLVTPSSALHAAGPDTAPIAAKTVSEALQWQLPRLLLNLQNATAAPLSVAALEVTVQRSELDRSALVFVPSETSAMLHLENIGWGKARHPQLKIGFAPAADYASSDARSAPTTETLELDDFDESLRVALKDRVPAALSGPAVTVFGRISYDGEDGGRRVLPFRTLAHLDRALAQRHWQPRFFHHLLLEAGKDGTTTLPVATSIGPQKSAQIKLRAGSERSARYQLLLTFKSADGAVLAAQPLDLQIFVPRSDAAGVMRNPSALKAASR